MNWSLVVCSFLASIAWASVDPGSPSTEKRRPQEQPPSYISHSQKADENVFLSHVKKHIGVNQQIPPVTNNELRVVTYNVRYIRGVISRKFDNENVKNDVKSDLEKMQATVIIFQQVSDWYLSDLKDFGDILTKAGYEYHNWGSCPASTPLGIFIASKVPLKFLFDDCPSHGDNLIAAEADFNGQKVAIVGTYLREYYYDKNVDLLKDQSAVRTRQANEIVDIIKNKIAPKYSHYLLVGDMNDVWDSQAIKVFRDSGLLYETFRVAKAQPPNYTCWKGITTDFIFVSKELAADVLGSYVYQTTTSVNLPVMVDFPKRVNWFRWGIIGLSGLAILGVITGLVLYFMKRSSSSAKPDSESF